MKVLATVLYVLLGLVFLSFLGGIIGMAITNVDLVFDAAMIFSISLCILTLAAVIGAWIEANG
jgi:hypothetical protein